MRKFPILFYVAVLSLIAGCSKTYKSHYEASEACPGQIEVELRPDQLSGNEDAQGHANDTPDHRHDGELAYYLVVISCRSGSCAHARFHG